MTKEKKRAFLRRKARNNNKISGKQERYVDIVHTLTVLNYGTYHIDYTHYVT